MHNHSYKHYLHLLTTKPQFNHWQKSALLLLAIALIAVGTVSAAFWQYRKDEPIRAQRNYLEYSLYGLNTTQESISDLLQSFQIAGDKTSSIYQQAAAPLSDFGYETIITDLEKTGDNIEAIKKLISSQKSQLFILIPQDRYSELNMELLNYYTSVEKTLDQITSKNRQIKEIIISAGPTFFLPNITDENLWETGNEEAIANYYKQNKSHINIALANLTQISPPEEFTNYHQNQIKYLENFAKTADEITAILSEKDTLEIPKIEKAYQEMISAKLELEPQSLALHQQRLRVLSMKNMLDQLAGTNLAKNSLGSQITDLLWGLPETKTDIITKFVNTILQARQTGEYIW